MNQGMRVDRPVSGGMVILGDKSYTIAWTTEPVDGKLPAGSIDIMLRRADSAATTYIARGILNQGWFNWDTTKPGSLEDGTPIDFMNITTGPDFIIQVSIQGTSVRGESGVFSIIRAPTPTPTVTPTPAPLQGVSVGYGSPILQTIQIPLSSQAHGIGVQMRPYPQSPSTGGAAMTAISMKVRYNPKYFRPYGVSSQYFPDVLQPIQIENVQPDISYFTFTLGSGTRPAQVSFSSSPITLELTPLKSGAAGGIGLSDVVITMPGRTDNASRIDPTNFPNIMTEIFDTTPAVPGDANGDGKVDIFDYNLVVSNFNRVGSNIPGDVNSDSKVDIFDYNLVITNFGK